MDKGTIHTGTIIYDIYGQPYTLTVVWYIETTRTPGSRIMFEHDNNIWYIDPKDVIWA